MARVGLDLDLGHRLAVAIDLARFDLWARQLQLDAAPEDGSAVAGDVATLEWVRHRIIHAVDASTAEQVDARLRDLRVAVDAATFADDTDPTHRLCALLVTA